MARAVQAEIPNLKIFGGVMRPKSEGEGTEVGMELKYCEHCGGLWVRERGTGIVYCDKCQSKVADLPAPRKRRGRLILPVRPHTAVEGYAVKASENAAAENDYSGLDGSELEDSDLDDSELDTPELDNPDVEAGGAA
jgi:hypothetical protein